MIRHVLHTKQAPGSVFQDTAVGWGCRVVWFLQTRQSKCVLGNFGAASVFSSMTTAVVHVDL